MLERPFPVHINSFLKKTGGRCPNPTGVEECPRVHFLCILNFKTKNEKKRRALSKPHWRGRMLKRPFPVHNKIKNK